MITRIHQYLDQDGRLVVEHELISGEPTKEYERFEGQAQVPLRGPQGVQNIPVTFPIEATSVEMAFEKFEACLEDRLAQIQKRLDEEKKKPTLLGVDQKPVKGTGPDLGGILT